MSDWIVKFGLAGVQDFIGQARKVRDFAAGSKLVSGMMHAALTTAGREDVEILLPATDGSADHIPQQLLLLVKDKTPEEVKVFGLELEAAAAEWISRNADDLAAKQASTHFKEAIHGQFAAAFAKYWAAVTVESASSGPDTYDRDAAAWNKLSGAFDARKHSRTFPQLPDIAGRACSLCGVRPFVHEVTKTGEYLCAVCLGKRLWGQSNLARKFPSTRRIAASRRFHRLVGNDLQQAEDIFEELDDLGPGTPSTEPQKAMLESIRTLSPYYAMVVFDGDNMGKWMGGVRFTTRDNFWKQQSALSSALLHFAKEAHTVAFKYGARVVYTGGDDGLMLCPLDRVLPLTAALHAAWNCCVQNELRGAMPNQVGFPTFSLHLSLLHEKEPLQAAVDELHHLLHAAKEEEGRDCFSILAKSGGGAPVCMRGKWAEFDGLVKLVEAIANWRHADEICPDKAELDRRAAEQLSSRLPHTIIECTEVFFGPDGRLGVGMKPTLEMELARLAGKSEAGAKRSGMAPHTAWLGERAAEVNPGKNRAFLRDLGFHRMSSALSVAAFLARQVEWRD